MSEIQPSLSNFFAPAAWRTLTELSPDEAIDRLASTYLDHLGGTISAHNLDRLNGAQHALLTYYLFRSQINEGGFIQLIQNGWGPYVFLNPFAKAMRLFGLKPFSKLVYEGRALYEDVGAEIEKERTDEEFMALYEAYPQFDRLDEKYMDMQEEVEGLLMAYVAGHERDFNGKSSASVCDAVEESSVKEE